MARDVAAAPWIETHVNLIGLWRTTVNNIDIEFNTLTIIDPVTNLMALVWIEDKTSAHIAQQYANTWLAQYPWPKACVYDNEGKFIRLEFQRLLAKCNIC